jgi:glutamine amidotransferase
MVRRYPIKSGNVIAHIRKATQGHVALENCHPFLRELLPVLRAHGSFNMLLSNGQALWAHGGTQLHWLQRQHPFRPATLADEDLSVDFAALTQPSDRVAVIATQPLTTGEAWQPIAPGELKVFVGGTALV